VEPTDRSPRHVDDRNAAHALPLLSVGIPMRRVDFASYLPAPPHLFGSVQYDLTQSNEYDEPDDRREEYAGEELSIDHNEAIFNSTPWCNVMF
jgi:hypothetical protein